MVKKVTLALVMSAVPLVMNQSAPLCPSEDTMPQQVACVWRADMQGNGEGRSFVVYPNGEVTYLS